MPKNIKRSINRFQAKDAEKKFMPAIKALSTHLHRTAPDVPEKVFFGYEIPGGTIETANGLTFQLQFRAVCVKSKFIKKNEIRPMINKWAIGFKVRIFLKSIIDNLFD